MNTAAVAAIGLGGAALAGVGMKYRVEGQVRAHTERRALVERERSTAEHEWATFSSGLNSEFPGLRLDTPADHARAAAYLSNHPAPAWLKVEHEESTRIKLSTAESGWLPEFHSKGARQPTVEEEMLPFVCVMGGAIGGAWWLSSALRHASTHTPLMSAAAALGGGAAAAFALGSVAEIIATRGMIGDEYDASWNLVRDVNSHR